MAKEGYVTLKTYIDQTILPNILKHYEIADVHANGIGDTINWRFFDQIPETPLHLLGAMQRLISETKFEAPLLKTIEALSQTPSKSSQQRGNESVASEPAMQLQPQIQSPKTIYAYAFHIANSMDLRGIVNYFGGASHSSDLPYLMGPSLYQQISRRKFTTNELKLCKRVRQLFGNFIKKGNPTPDRLYDAWRPYTAKQKNIQMLGDVLGAGTIGGGGGGTADATSFIANFELNRAELEAILRAAPGDTETRIVSNSIHNPYQLAPNGNNNPKNGIDGSRTSKSYLSMDYETTEYFNSLSKVYTFWNDLLPKFQRHRRLLAATSNGRTNEIDSNDTSYVDRNANDQFAAGIGTGSKYKHAFFSMLILVCLLLSVLCVCVYILKKNHRNIDTSFL